MIQYARTTKSTGYFWSKHDNQLWKLKIVKFIHKKDYEKKKFSKKLNPSKQALKTISRIFSQFGNKLDPSWARSIWQKY
jgi:hypothetical protein